MTVRTLLPEQWKRAVELMVHSLPANASLDVVAAQIAGLDVRVVPLRRRASGQGFEPVPIKTGFHDPWENGAYDIRGVQRDRERWRRADAVGVRFSYAAEADFVLDPDESVLIPFFQKVGAK